MYLILHLVDTYYRRTFCIIRAVAGRENVGVSMMHYFPVFAGNKRFVVYRL